MNDICLKLSVVLEGLWPCWPAGNTHIISDITGQIVEKRDIRSLDDLKDYRIYKLTLE